MTEREMQAMSLQYLALHPKLKVLRIPDEVYLVLRLAAEGKPVGRGLAIRARTALAAWPDELVFRALPGLPYPLTLIRENKSEAGRPTPAQKAFYVDLKEKGIRYAMPYGFEANKQETDEFALFRVPRGVEIGS